MASKKSAPQSEKGESGRGRLQRETVVQAALTLMNEIGLDALSLRRLADELHVQAPALYWHFKNKQELLNEMAESMLDSRLPSLDDVLGQLEWSEVMLAVGRNLRRALMAYRDGARLMASADISRVGILSLEIALSVLVKSGFPYQQALVGILTTVNYTLGFTFEAQANPQSTASIKDLQKLIEDNHLPYLAEAFQENLAPIDSETEFEAGLQLIVNGTRPYQGTTNKNG